MVVPRLAIFLLLTVTVTVTSTEAAQAPYVERGDRVERQFRLYTGRLDTFRQLLRETIVSAAPDLLPELDREDPPPEPGVYGYQLLPAIVEETDARRRSISTFSYSWEATERYIENEAQRLDSALGDLEAFRVSSAPIAPAAIRETIAQYRMLVDNLKTIDQYLQYNRFWQRAIAEDRSRFDRLTEIYDLLIAEEPGAADAAREFLGRPSVPDYLEIDRPGSGPTVVRLPVYTDILDDAFLEAVESGVEGMWSVGGESGFMLDIELRKRSPVGSTPRPGDRIDLMEHAARFPDDGALLTTGAESTYGFVGEYVALGPGDITVRTLAHEFGHVLGFADGYIRGYRDLGEDGFEILELTSAFEDIMSAPREGRVLGSHFELVIAGVAEIAGR